MAKLRVHDIAGEFGITADEVIALLRRMDVAVRSHMSLLTDDQVTRIRARWESEKHALADRLLHERLEAERARAAIFRESTARGFRIWLDPGEAPTHIIADVLGALSRLHHAAGGAGLQFSIDGENVLIVQEEPR